MLDNSFFKLTVSFTYQEDLKKILCFIPGSSKYLYVVFPGPARINYKMSVSSIYSATSYILLSYQLFHARRDIN